MVHDKECELLRAGNRHCHCAQRAYEKDPIPGVKNPYVVQDDNELDEWMAH